MNLFKIAGLIYVKNAYFTQAARHSLIWFNIKNNQFGWCVPRWLSKKIGIDNCIGNLPNWYRYGVKNFMPIFKLVLNSETGQRNQKWIVRLELLGFKLGYKTWGESSKDDNFRPGGFIFMSPLCNK